MIVVLNAAFGFLHEHRAAQSIALLRALAAPQGARPAVEFRPVGAGRHLARGDLSCSRPATWCRRTFA